MEFSRLISQRRLPRSSDSRPVEVVLAEIHRRWDDCPVWYNRKEHDLWLGIRAEEPPTLPDNPCANCLWTQVDRPGISRMVADCVRGKDVERITSAPDDVLYLLEQLAVARNELPKAGLRITELEEQWEDRPWRET